MKRLIPLLGLALLLGVTTPATVQAQRVRVEHAPLPATATTAQDEGMILYSDPETGEVTAKAPPGAQLDFPEFRFRPEVITEETRADGSTITRLNGQGMEAQVLRIDADGQARVTCSNLIESARPRAGKAGDLRQRNSGSTKEVEHVR